MEEEGRVGVQDLTKLSTQYLLDEREKRRKEDPSYQVCEIRCFRMASLGEAAKRGA